MENFNFDMVVVGAGFSGVVASIAAARKGLKVGLIGDRPVFGGNSSSEIRVGINGAATNGHSPSVYTREGGIVEELKLAMAYHNSRDIAYFDLIYAEKNITSFLNTVATDIEMKDGSIVSVDAVQLSSDRRFRFTAPLFLDSSGDGTIAFKAGADFMYGREARSEFNEPFAPLEADDYTLGSTIMFHSTYTDKAVKFNRPKFAYDITKMPFYEGLGTKSRVFGPRPADKSVHGCWWFEYGGQVDTIKDSEEIALELRKIVYGMWDYVKNSGKFEDVDNLALTYVTPIPGKRESRRFIGDHVLTQNDVDEKREFSDSIAIAGWEMDVHAPKGIYDTEVATHWHYVAGSFNIPFGIMYSRNIPNLFVAGRNMSSTHIAFGTTRLACTGGVAGQAVGTAAYLCKKYGVSPRDIRENHIDELRTLLLEDHQTIIGFEKPRTPAKLNVTASSTKKYENANTTKLVKLTRKMGLVLPFESSIDSFKVKVSNSGETTKLKFSVFTGKRCENYIPNLLLKTDEVEIAQNADDWVELPICCENSEDKKVYVCFEPNEKLSLYGNDERLTGAISFVTSEFDEESYAKYKGDFKLWRTRHFHLNALELCFCDVQPECDIYRAENVLNGYTRPYGTPNLWISERKGTTESLTLAVTDKSEFSAVELVFNTMLEEDNLSEVPRTIVRDYTVFVTYADGRVREYPIRENFTCVNKVDIEKGQLSEVKIVFEENWGSEYFEVYSVELKHADC